MSMHGEALLESLIQGIYKAAVGSAGWVAFLSSFAAAIESINPSFYFADTTGPDGSIEISVGLDDTQRQAYRQYYAHRNIWIRGARSFLRPGVVRSSDQMCSSQEFMRSEWYADFCRPLGWRRGIGATLMQEGPTTANIGAFRSSTGAEYTAKDFALVTALMPHLQRGLKMHRQLAESRAHGRALEAVLHGLTTPALLVAQDGMVRFMNTAAEQLIAASDGLVVMDGRLRALRSKDTVSLQALIANAARTSAGEGGHSGGSLRITSSRDNAGFEVLVSPLPARQDDWILKQPTIAAVFVTDHYGSSAIRDSEVAGRHGLTRTESKIAVAVSRGLVGKQICRELNISYNTLKTHLRHIYVKTGTRHHSELARLLSSNVRLPPVQEHSGNA